MRASSSIRRAKKNLLMSYFFSSLTTLKTMIECINEVYKCNFKEADDTSTYYVFYILIFEFIGGNHSLASSMISIPKITYHIAQHH